MPRSRYASTRRNSSVRTSSASRSTSTTHAALSQTPGGDDREASGVEHRRNSESLDGDHDHRAGRADRLDVQRSEELASIS